MRNPESTNDPPSVVDADRIIDLVHGLLPTEERDALLERIADDPALEELLRRQTLAVELARIQGAPLPAAAKTSWWERFVHSVRNPRPATVVGFGLAVMLIVMLWKAPGPDDATIPALPGDLESMRLRSGDALPETITDGIDAYGDEDLAKAVARLGEAETDGVAELVRRVYLGSALARSGRFEEAIPILDQVVDRPLPDPWGAEAAWARAICLKETGRIEEARAALTTLGERSDPVGERARRLQRALAGS